MPRPKRARNAPPSHATKAQQEPLSDTDHLEEERGRARGRRRTTRSTGSRLSLGEEDAIREANRARDAALDKLANEDATTTASGGQTVGDDTRSSVEIGRHAMATPAMRRDTTGLDLADDDVFGDLDESFADGEIPRGGRSADSTSLSFSSFKPRSRQSSIIGRNDPPIRPSSRGPNTPGVGSSFNIGVFRRRAREPSILGTSRRPRSETGGTTNNSEVESEGEFEPPEAESTPLNLRRRTRNSSRGGRSSQSAEPAPAAGSRKRRSVESHEEGARPEKTSRVESEEPRPQLEDEGSDSELSAIASSPSPPPPGFFQRPVTPVNMDDITAPPASSDSEEDAQVWPDIHTLAKKRRRPSVTTPMRTADDALSTVSSPPSLTHSPNFAERATRQRGRAAKRHHQESPKVTTADLTNLLPKRRYKRVRDDPFGLGSDEEFDTADLAQDDDELSYLDARAARKRKANRSRSRAGSDRPASRAGSRAASRAGSRVRGGNASSVLKPKQTPASAERRSARIINSSSRKTYQHRRSSDKENESGSEDEEQDGEGLSQFVPLPDDTFETGDTGGAEAAPGRRDFATTEELKQAAKKFKEVDKWELEYEEVAEPPSPQNAR